MTQNKLFNSTVSWINSVHLSIISWLNQQYLVFSFIFNVFKKEEVAQALDPRLFISKTPVSR